MKINYELGWKIVRYTYMCLGLICILTQLVESGVYDYGEDATLMIVGLLLFNIGISIKR